MSQRYEIEVSGAFNEGLLFRPADQKLRGEWNCGRAARFDGGKQIRMLAHEVGDIPGERIYVDLTKKVWGYYDPLNTPDQTPAERKVRVAVQRFITKNPELVNSPEIGFRDPVERTDCDEDTLKDVLYWMRLALESDAAKVVPGSQDLPSLRDIQAMPGKRKLHGELLVDKESNEAVQPFLYDVPIPKRTAKTGN